MERKSLILNFFIILIALFFSFNIYKNKNKELNLLIQKKEVEKKKNEVLNRILKQEEAYLSLKNEINKKDVSLALDKLRRLAKDYSLEIQSVRPLGESEEEDYKKYLYEFVLLVKNYHLLAKFINQLEQDKDIYFIESLEIAYDNKKLKSYLKIATVFLK
ncbi:MAG: hypothetical protein N2Z79_03540 [Candidatus Omnitrophica bacterium]|nr:hypothetical protein [Candidatus Omnitrophota bacterium]